MPSLSVAPTARLIAWAAFLTRSRACADLVALVNAELDHRGVPKSGGFRQLQIWEWDGDE